MYKMFGFVQVGEGMNSLKVTIVGLVAVIKCTILATVDGVNEKLLVQWVTGSRLLRLALVVFIH